MENTILAGLKEIIATREYSAKKLQVSVESITNWTKQLQKEDCLESYYHRRGYCSNQKVVRTSSLPQISLKTLL